MARIVLGLASSHGPQLEIPPTRWREQGERGRAQAEHRFRGESYSFPELRELRKDDHFERYCTEDAFAAHFERCQAAIGHLAKTLTAAHPDVCIVLGDDQDECFHDDLMPVFAIFTGDETEDFSASDSSRWRFGDPSLGNPPAQRTSHPADPALAGHLIESLMTQGFDLARTSKLPVSVRGDLVGHAFFYVYRRLMDNEVGPHVPILVNTYNPPNVPSARRCFDFGRALRVAVDQWDENKTVAFIASGGLSHTVIDEELDATVIDALASSDIEKLAEYPDSWFRDGTSEIKNWIILAGTMAGTGLEMKVVDYVPCYRTEAGTGVAMGFAEWV